MASTGGWFDRYVDSLPDKVWFKFLSNSCRGSLLGLAGTEAEAAWWSAVFGSA